MLSETGWPAGAQTFAVDNRGQPDLVESRSCSYGINPNRRAECRRGPIRWFERQRTRQYLIRADHIDTGRQRALVFPGLSP